MITLLLAFIEVKYNGYFSWLYLGTVMIDLSLIEWIRNVNL